MFLCHSCNQHISSKGKVRRAKLFYLRDRQVKLLR
ncbi:50S ribosomal protein L19 [bacterium D16-51]|nr:50S ribosomal protein L19 [bacterium D16-59]RKI57067.1 50S ribosomal protein L19 [bacterium D16-51]